MCKLFNLNYFSSSQCGDALCHLLPTFSFLSPLWAKGCKVMHCFHCLVFACSSLIFTHCPNVATKLRHFWFKVGKQRPFITPGSYDYSCLLDVLVVSAKLKGLWCDVKFILDILYMLDTVELSYNKNQNYQREENYKI